MSYGAKYRIKGIFTKSNAVKRFKYNIEIFIQKLMYKYSLPGELFSEWKYHIVRDLKEKYIKNFEGLSEEKYIDLRKTLKNIQDDFIITYVDKASTN